MRYQEPRKRFLCLLSWNGSQVERRCSHSDTTACALGKGKDGKMWGMLMFWKNNWSSWQLKKKKTKTLSITCSNLITKSICITIQTLKHVQKQLNWRPITGAHCHSQDCTRALSTTCTQIPFWTGLLHYCAQISHSAMHTGFLMSYKLYQRC